MGGNHVRTGTACFSGNGVLSTVPLEAVRNLWEPRSLGQDTQWSATSGELARCIHALPDKRCAEESSENCLIGGVKPCGHSIRADMKPVFTAVNEKMPLGRFMIAARIQDGY